MADYDADGVHEDQLDKCPDTKLGVAVDADGCSVEQLDGGFFGQIKKQIITGVGVAITAGQYCYS